jgi:MFS family permease
MAAISDGRRGAAWPILLGAAVLLSLAMGMRQSLGLFIQPMTQGIGATVADFTLSIAVQNMVWGLTQPAIGALADRYGLRPVAIAGALLYVAGIACSAFATGPLALTLGTGPLIGIALSCSAASLNMSAAARAVPAEKRSRVLGMISACGSLGTFAAAPLAQVLIAGPGWRVAMFGFVALAVLMVPAAAMMGSADLIPTPARSGEAASMRAVLADALRRRAFVVMAGAYFVCGLQLVFLTTHLPTYLAICGMDPMLSAEAIAVVGVFNVAGSYLWGWLGGIYPKHVLLGLIYVLRSLALAIYFLHLPTPATTLIFAATMGLLWLGVVPLVSGIVAAMFGLRYMATITGIAFLSHQAGSFLGAWGGGMVLEVMGNYDRAWQFGVTVGLVAGLAQMAFGHDTKPVKPALRPAVA